MKAFILCVAITTLAACKPQPDTNIPSAMETWAKELHMRHPFCPEAKGTPISADLYSIVRDPGSYEGKFVEVHGYYYSYFEHQAIYSTPEVGLYNKDFSTGLWVLAPIDSFNDKLVKITGTVTSKTKGHLGQWAATLCAIDIQES